MEVKNFTDLSTAKDKGIRSCHLVSIDMRMHASSTEHEQFSARISKSMRARGVPKLTQMILDRFELPPSVEMEILLQSKSATRKWSRDDLVDSKYETPDFRGDFVESKVHLFYPERYLYRFVRYFLQERSCISMFARPDDDDFARVYYGAPEVNGNYMTHECDRHSIAFKFLGTMFGNHVFIDIDTAYKRSEDIIIACSYPSWADVKRLSRNPHIENFPEIEWQPRHRLLMHPVLAKNPYI